jgi:tetratricopeptide (TPR) repeat protein
MPSKIAWTDETWNPITGCTQISEGCANCYAKRMAKRAAENAYQRLTDRHGAQPGLRAALALTLLEVDSNRAAISQLKSVLSDARFSRLSPVIRAEIRARLGQAYWQAGSFGPAAKHARKALQSWPHCSRALAVLGIVAYEMARFRRARKHLRKAVKANPNFALPFHYLGRANQALGQRRAGRKHLRRYLWLRPKGPLAADSKKAMYR